MESQEKVGRVLEKLSVYAMMKHDENTKDALYDSLTSKITALGAKLGANTAFIMPELTALDPEILNGYINNPKLKDYEYNLFHGKKWKNWLLWDEIELIQNENVPIPEEYQELIDDLTEYDITGGIALRNQDLGELV
jgi:oligoendopeptidase F